MKDPPIVERIAEVAEDKPDCLSNRNYECDFQNIPTKLQVSDVKLYLYLSLSLSISLFLVLFSSRFRSFFISIN